MGDVKVSNSAPVQAASEVSKPQKAESALGKHLSGIKNALFGRTGASILAGAASGALLAGPVGAVVGGVAGLGFAAGQKAAERGNKTLSVLNTAAAGALVGVAFGLPGLLVGGASYLFATGKAQQAAEKVGNFLTNHSNKAEPAPAQ